MEFEIWYGSRENPIDTINANSFQEAREKAIKNLSFNKKSK